MGQLKNVFASRWGIIIVGAVIGVLAAVLQKLGNPGNMGICVACFERDIAGAIGMHRAAVVQYMRPEIIGFVVGSLIAAFLFKEFRPRLGSAPIVRFFLGAFAMIGALVFLGCPWRALLRLAGGDGNALFGIAGLIVGIWIGVLFLKGGYNLGRTEKTYSSAGWLLPLAMIGFFVLMLIYPQIQGEPKDGVLFYSVKGPGAMHAPLVISIIVGLGIGFFSPEKSFLHHGCISRPYSLPPEPSVRRALRPGRVRFSHQPGAEAIPSRICQSTRGPYHGAVEFRGDGPGGSCIRPCGGMSGQTTVPRRGRRRRCGRICMGNDCGGGLFT